MSIRTLIASVALVASLSAGAAQAADTASVKVQVSDLDLSSHAGAVTVLHRIENAARIICGEPGAPNDLSGAKQYKACISAAMNNGVTGLGSPMVTAVYEGRGSTFLAAR
jgi:UrcA family protein